MCYVGNYQVAYSVNIRHRILSHSISRKINRSYLNRVRRWADQNFPDGHTLVNGECCYSGVSENSAFVDVLSECNLPLKKQLDELKCDLSEEVILVIRS